MVQETDTHITPLPQSSVKPLFWSRISVFRSQIIDLFSGSISKLNLPLKLVNQSDSGSRVKVIFFFRILYFDQRMRVLKRRIDQLAPKENDT